MKLYHGKYRGTVRNNIDPEVRGRLLVNVPAVMGAGGTTWALPCFPYAGQLAGTFIVPPIGAAVWVEFEGGNPASPIWVGGFYPTGQAPPMGLAAPPGTQEFVIQTTLQNVISIKDVPGPAGGIMLQASTGAMILINDAGIVLQDGKGGIITMTGGIVSINPPNLVVAK
jgi:uncharacterized protein involved in type VI secretion and phage assembly